MKILAVSCAVLIGLAVLLGSDRPVEGPAEFDGFIEAYRVINLSSATDGLLEAVNVDVGDTVRQGQVVATLESSVEQATLVLAEERARLEGEIQEQAARLQYVKSRLDQDTRLHHQGLVSEDQFKQVNADNLLSEAGLLKARENLRLAELERARAAAALELRTIRSPIDGVVIERFLSPGELVTKLSQSKIVAIAQIHPLRAEVLVPGELFGKIAVGMSAAVVPEGLADTRLEARVEAVTPYIDAASGTFKVRLEISNPERQLPPGLKCRVRFVPEAAPAPNAGEGGKEVRVR